ncbi:MAG: inositol phosphorylceramide synthase [Nocardioidaceae bacterium]|nr:inositol phosphorylceramide synthase [Nocardioidaceae bacterium]
MKWATWDEAAIAAGISFAIFLVLTRFPSSRPRNAVMPALKEFAFVASLYSLWRLARQLPFTHPNGAVDRARWIDDFQHALHLPTEISMQHFVIQHDRLAELVNDYYATIHVPALIIFLIWLFVRHRDKYPHWRNGLAFVTLCCLFIRFIRVAPPRFIPELGFVDLSQRYGLSVYGPVGSGISDQYAAMPSIHIAWAAVVALGIFSVSPSRWRWVFVLHLPITFFVVAATGHHWWLDGIVAVVLLAIGLRLDTWVRTKRAARSTGNAKPTIPATEDAT